MGKFQFGRRKMEFWGENFKFEGENCNFEGEDFYLGEEKMDFCNEIPISDKLFSTMDGLFEVWQLNFKSFGIQTFVLSGALCKHLKIFSGK